MKTKPNKKSSRGIAARCFWSNETGQGLVEYTLIIAAIALVSVVALGGVGENANAAVGGYNLSTEAPEPTPEETSEPEVYTITYDLNGGTSDSPLSQLKTEGQITALLTFVPERESETTPTYIKLYPKSGTVNGFTSASGYTQIDGAGKVTTYTFDGWEYIEPAIGETCYVSPGAVWALDADVTLTARWTESSSYNSVTVPVATRDGYSFKGWGKTNASSTVVATPANGYRFTPTAITTSLYAKWTAGSSTVTITYNANGGVGAPANQTGTAGSTVISSTRPTMSTGAITGKEILVELHDLESGVFVDNGFDYSDWSGISESMAVNDTNALAGGVYPIDTPVSYVSDAYKDTNVVGTIEYEFSSWNTKADGSGVSYAPGATYTGTSNLTLYAQYDQSVTSTMTVELPLLSQYKHSFAGWVPVSDDGSLEPISGTVNIRDLPESYFYYIGSGPDDQHPEYDLLYFYGLSLKPVWESAPYTATYDANGGINAPGPELLYYGDSMTSEEPTRNEPYVGTSTITLNANGGSVSTSSVTYHWTIQYYFQGWTSWQNGTNALDFASLDIWNVAYAYGLQRDNSHFYDNWRDWEEDYEYLEYWKTPSWGNDEYPYYRDATFYAVWQPILESVETDSGEYINLPTPTRDGYTFAGWSTNPSASSGVTRFWVGNPSSNLSENACRNITLYAIWQ